MLTGGQSGADRAATDFALAAGISYGGWVPRGGWAEDFPTPPGVLVPYPCFTETASADLAVRTVRNVDDADAVLALSLGETGSSGTGLALERAELLDKSHAAIDMTRSDASRTLEALVSTLGPTFALNVAGPRESEQPGIYAASRAFLVANVGLFRWA